ncbi:MAG: M24 family metallopeptidase [Planctomycetota bacterium]|nr:M24 family metallopeptidase [Planctomycetota bacterium]
MDSSKKTARIMAGVPTLNASLYRRIRFLVGDPVALLEVPGVNGTVESKLILRDIEIERAKLKADAQSFYSPKDFAPADGLSGDRELATAQAAAECLRRSGVTHVIADRSFPMIFVEMLRRQQIEIACDPDWGILDRRQKDEREIEAIARAQEVTEIVMRRACEMIGNAEVVSEGTCLESGALQAAVPGQLVSNGQLLTSQLVRTKIDQWLLEFGFSNPDSIVACGPQGGDCHEHGSGPLVTGQPIIVDIFPRDKSTLYNGDCTRTVVHGHVPPKLERMHAAILAAKSAATEAIRPGITGHSVHEVTASVIKQHGFEMRLPIDSDPIDFTAMTHGTGHGLGLEVHEAPLLAENGVEIVEGDVLTIEPGLYCKSLGGIRVEDMVVVTANGCRNLNRLPQGLTWRVD